MVRFVTFVHKYLWHGTNTCEQKWQIWPSTSTGTMVFCWSCKRSWCWSNANPPVAGQGLTRSQNSCRIKFSSKNGREISSSVFGTTRWPQLYMSRLIPSCLFKRNLFEICSSSVNQPNIKAALWSSRKTPLINDWVQLWWGCVPLCAKVMTERVVQFTCVTLVMICTMCALFITYLDLPVTVKNLSWE